MVHQEGTKAIYRFGSCLRPKDGLIEIDVSKLLSGDIPGDTPMDEAVRRLNDLQPQQLANRVFGSIYNYYKEHHVYPVQGGYYA